MNEKQGLLSEIKQPLSGGQIFVTLLTYAVMACFKLFSGFSDASLLAVNTLLLPCIWGFVVMSKSQALISRIHVWGLSNFALLFFATKCICSVFVGWAALGVFTIKLIAMVIVEVIQRVKNNKALKENENNEITENT